MTKQDSAQNISALILAGGESRRMGHSDKSFVQLKEKPLLDHVIDRIQAQTKYLLISTNSNTEAYRAYGYPLIKDKHCPPRGPLEGLLAGMRYIRGSPHIKSEWILSCPVDYPLIPLYLTQRLMQTLNKTPVDACYAESQGQGHYLCALWSTHLHDKLNAHLNKGQYSTRSFLKSIRSKAVTIELETQASFSNINSEDDLRDLEALINTPQ